MVIGYWLLSQPWEKKKGPKKEPGPMEPKEGPKERGPKKGDHIH